jgi:hypothetical protein
MVAVAIIDPSSFAIAIITIVATDPESAESHSQVKFNPSLTILIDFETKLDYSLPTATSPYSTIIITPSPNLQQSYPEAFNYYIRIISRYIF